MTYLDDLTGVFGYPVAENPTVVMQEAAFRALGLRTWRYLTIEVRPEGLGDAVQGLRAMNFRGINLTIPHKAAVMQHLDRVADDARLIGAVNTVRNDNGVLIGENTDGKGFLRSLTAGGGVDPSGLRVAILGAGGAARAIAVELALAGAARIVIVNRSPERGSALAELVNERTAAESFFVVWDTPYSIPADVDVLVNATSIGLYPDLSAKPSLDYASIRPGMLVCDVIPNPPRTAFLQAAAGRGARTLDGLGMLVYQGVIGFRMWTGRDAPEQEMKTALAAAFEV